MSMPSSSDARGHQRGQPAVLEPLLDQQPLLAGEAAVMGADDVLAGELVELQRQPLRQPAAVDEHDGASVRADQLQDARVDLRARCELRCVHRSGRSTGLLLERKHLADRGHVLDRHDDLQIERLANTGVHDPAPAAAAPASVAAVRARLCDRRGSPPRRSAAVAWPTARCAAAAWRSMPRAAPARAPGGRRAWCRQGRGSHR